MKDFTINVETLTLGQTEFITEFAGLTLGELQEQLSSGNFGMKALLAILAVAHNPGDPAAGVVELRNMPLLDMGDLEVVGMDDAEK